MVPACDDSTVGEFNSTTGPLAERTCLFASLESDDGLGVTPIPELADFCRTLADFMVDDAG